MQNFRVTDIQQLFNDHSSYTTRHTPLIIHHSSYHSYTSSGFNSSSSRQLQLQVQIAWQVQHFVYLHVQISWQAQHFGNLHVQISWQAQHFVNLHVQISWQAQHFVHLHVQISWQAQYKMRCGEIANAQNAVFFNGPDGSEAGKSRFAERRVRDGLGSCSDHARNRPSIGIRVFTCFLKCRFRGRCSTL